MEQINGVDFITDENGKKIKAVIDLAIHNDAFDDMVRLLKKEKQALAKPKKNWFARFFSSIFGGNKNKTLAPINPLEGVTFVRNDDGVDTTGFINLNLNQRAYDLFVEEVSKPSIEEPIIEQPPTIVEEPIDEPIVEPIVEESPVVEEPVDNESPIAVFPPTVEPIDEPVIEPIEEPIVEEPIDEPEEEPVVIVPPVVVPPAPTFEEMEESAINQQVALGVIDKAREYLGTPHVLGGETKQGIDCSALTMLAFLSKDIRLPRTSQAQSETGEVVFKKSLRTGDLVFFATGQPGRVSHVGIVSNVQDERVTFIHTSSSRGVMESNLNSNYWTKAYMMARRVIV